DVIVAHKQAQRFPIHVRLELRKRSQCFEFRAKKEDTVVPPVIEGLLSGAIAGQKQSSFVPIPCGESEHYYKTSEVRLDPRLAEGGQHRLGIGMASEGVAFGFQLAS